MSKLRLVQVLLFVGGLTLITAGIGKNNPKLAVYGVILLVGIIVVKMLRFIFMD